MISLLEELGNDVSFAHVSISVPYMRACTTYKLINNSLHRLLLFVTGLLRFGTTNFFAPGTKVYAAYGPHMKWCTCVDKIKVSRKWNTMRYSHPTMTGLYSLVTEFFDHSKTSERFHATFGLKSGRVANQVGQLLGLYLARDCSTFIGICVKHIFNTHL